MTTMIRGTALVPGVSKNNRYYSAEAIRGAVERAQPRIRAGQMVMRSSHDAGDDTLRVAGVVRTLDVAADGSAKFTAELADSTAGRDIAALVKGPRPFVNGVSIAGYWLGKIQRVSVEGQNFEAGQGLDLEAIDFTHRPGVDGARIAAETVTRGGRVLIFEEAPGPITPAGLEPAEPTARDYSRMTSEEFHQATAQHWGAQFADNDERRRRQGGSPFNRGLTGQER